MTSVSVFFVNECFLNFGCFHRSLILKGFFIRCEKDQLGSETDFNIEYFANFSCDRAIDSGDAELPLELSIKLLDLSETVLAGTGLAQFGVLEVREPLSYHLVLVHELRHHVLYCDLSETRFKLCLAVRG